MIFYLPQYMYLTACAPLVPCITVLSVIAEVSVVTNRSESMPKFWVGPEPEEGEGLALIKDKYIWNGPVYGESTFVREMHQISTIGAESGWIKCSKQ